MPKRAEPFELGLNSLKAIFYVDPSVFIQGVYLKMRVLKISDKILKIFHLISWVISFLDFQVPDIKNIACVVQCLSP